MNDNLERYDLQQADRPELVSGERLDGQTRYVGLPRDKDDQDLGPYRLLPGTWRNVSADLGGRDFRCRGWASTPLPFADPAGTNPPRNYRLLNHQFHEELKFTLVDNDVPNRGIRFAPGASKQTDQLVLTLDYEQVVTQVAGADNPNSGLAGNLGDVIHHEPGLFLHMLNRTKPEGFTVARLGTIPHGDALLALGNFVEEVHAEGSPIGPNIPAINGLPVGVDPDLGSFYLEPYNHFQQNPFRGLFNPVRPHELLRRTDDQGNDNFAGTILEQGSTIRHLTRLTFDTTLGTGGIHNIPFVVRQANSAEMKFTMWIMEVQDTDGAIHHVLQYAQVVFLDFFPTRDGTPGRVRWPHVAINTLVKVSGPTTTAPEKPECFECPDLSQS